MKIKEFADEQKIALFSEYLESSRAFYDLIGIDMNDAELNADHSMLSIEFKPKYSLQAYRDVVHGGIFAVLLDSVAGVLALIHGLKQDKIVLTKTMSVDFYQKMITRGSYKVMATIHYSNGDYAMSTAYISEVLADQKENKIAKAELRFAFKGFILV